MNRVEAALRGIASDLNVLHIRWALVGGFAVSVRTEPRFTRDVDVAVLVDGDPAAVLGAADRAAARTAAELIVERGFARGRPLTALTEAFLAGSDSA